ncbi:MAG: carbohydrate ABC transporter substrate-binding protein [Gammaproteobacteria bacterium]|nr:MAG: carbohydrate ABC transporter substrate-binding protein [Gammaproteobacteria bacterium]
MMAGRWVRSFLGGFAGLLLLAGGPRADTLTLAVMPVSATQREAINELTARYNSRGVHQVLVVAYPHEQFKARIDALLSDPDSGLDVIVWFGGERLRRLIRNGRLRPLNELTDVLNEDRFTASALSTVRYAERYWGMPVSYYPWGIFYRKSVFRQLGLKPPATGQALDAVMARLRAAGLTPFALGSDAPWTLLAWFDYLNLRLNGKPFHERLTAGEIPFTDDQVRQVFTVGPAG